MTARNKQENNESNSGSDISVSTVNTKDLSDLSFLEDEDDGVEIGWSRDDFPVNVASFTQPLEQQVQFLKMAQRKTFSAFLCQKNCLRTLLKKQPDM